LSGRRYSCPPTCGDPRGTSAAFWGAGRSSGPPGRGGRGSRGRRATAGAPPPPPQTFTSVRYCPVVDVTSNGWRMIMRDDSRPKYSSAGRALTVIPPSPARSLTRATEVLRLPVPEKTLLSALIDVADPQVSGTGRCARCG